MQGKLLSVKIMVISTISCFTGVNTLNILGVFPSPLKSHFFVFSPYLRELVNRGHNVTVISYYPQKEPIPNYHDINLGKNSQSVAISLPISRSLFVIFLSLTLLQSFGGPVTCRRLFEDENVQNLLESQTKFDLTILEQFNSNCGLALAHVLGAPVIGITSHMLLPCHYSRYGVPYNPSYTTFDFLQGGTKPSFLQRIQRSIMYIYINLINDYFTRALEQSIVSEYLTDIPPLNELEKDIKLVLLYQNFMLSGSSLLPPNVIEVGGYHIAKPKPLPDDLQKFIDESEHGVIYISFGSILKASSMSLIMLENIISALVELPQRVIWKWDKSKLPGNPKNIYLAKWLPQNDILAHPNVRTFFSHCGQLGTTEAIYHGVPKVGMPINGDQPTNAAAIEESGLGVQISLESLTKDNLLEKFRIVLNPSFREKVKRLSKAWHDRPIKALDGAIFWTEFAARNQNFTFKPPVVDVPLYQYLCLDVLSVLFIFLGAIIISLKYFISFLIRFIYSSNQETHSRAKKIKVN